MATLQELLDLEGVIVAGEFDFDGNMLAYEAKMDMSEEMAADDRPVLRRLYYAQDSGFFIR
jgi:roadblock/LC7 domain-containing protein